LHTSCAIGKDQPPLMESFSEPRFLREKIMNNIPIITEHNGDIGEPDTCWRIDDKEEMQKFTQYLLDNSTELHSKYTIGHVDAKEWAEINKRGEEYEKNGC